MMVSALFISSKSQSTIGFEGGYVFGFQGKHIQIMDETVSDYKANGVYLLANYKKTIRNSEWSFNSGIGTKLFSIRGITDSASRIYGMTLRVNLFIGANYPVNEKLNFGLNIITENNRDFEDLLDAKSDMWRYSLGIESSYIVTKNISFIVRFSKILYPNIDLYLLLNPANQFSVGFNFKIK